MSKLKLIQNILQQSTFSEVLEFAKHFNVPLDMSALNNAISSMSPVVHTTEVQHLVKHTHEIRAYKPEGVEKFPTLQCIKLMRYAQPGLALKDAKDNVEDQLHQHPDYVVIVTAQSRNDAFDLIDSWYNEYIVMRGNLALRPYEIV